MTLPDTCIKKKNNKKSTPPPTEINEGGRRGVLIKCNHQHKHYMPPRNSHILQVL